jgi:hypothetical protein
MVLSMAVMCSTAAGPTDRAARADAVLAEFATALKARDPAGLGRFRHPRMAAALARDGNEPDGDFKPLLDYWDRHGFTLLEVTWPAPVHVTTKAADFFFYDAVQQFDSFEGRRTSPMRIVVVAEGAGARWSVIYLTCLDSSHIRAIAPDFVAPASLKLD